MIDPPADEGSISGGMDITGQLPWDGQMLSGGNNTTSGSFYVVGNLIPGSTVSVSALNATESIKLQVNTISDFLTGEECDANETIGTGSEICVGVTVNPSGILYVRVHSGNGYDNSVGGTFTINVTQ